MAVRTAELVLPFIILTNELIKLILIMPELKDCCKLIF